MAKVRTREPFRGQGVMRFEIPEDTLAEDHRARVLWRVVETLDLSAFTADAKAREGVQGRPLTSVRLLLSLWLYAISIGIGSARKIERLTTSDDAFRWLVGDQRVSHDKLAEFRVAHGAALDKLFTDVLAVQGGHWSISESATGSWQTLNSKLSNDLDSVTLADLETGQMAEIIRLAEHDGDLLHWFYDEGLVPGTEVEVRSAQPAAGQVVVEIGGGERAIGERAAAGLFVRRAA